MDSSCPSSKYDDEDIRESSLFLNLSLSQKYRILSYLPEDLMKKVIDFHNDKKEPVILLNRLKNPDRLEILAKNDLVQLEMDGFVIKDDFLGNTISIDGIIEEIEFMKGKGDMQRAGMISQRCTTWGDSNLRGDWNVFINSPCSDFYPKFSLLVKHLSSLKAELNECVEFGCKDSEIQISLYPPNCGARYVRHLDANDNINRRLTCIFYLNKNWCFSDGGLLRLYLKDELGNEKEVDVEPISNRLIIFQSLYIPHEVLPTRSKRYALTMWLY